MPPFCEAAVVQEHLYVIQNLKTLELIKNFVFFWVIYCTYKIQYIFINLKILIPTFISGQQTWITKLKWSISQKKNKFASELWINLLNGQVFSVPTRIYKLLAIPEIEFFPIHGFTSAISFIEIDSYPNFHFGNFFFPRTITTSVQRLLQSPRKPMSSPPILTPQHFYSPPFVHFVPSFEIHPQPSSGTPQYPGPIVVTPEMQSIHGSQHLGRLLLLALVLAS